MMAAHVLLAVGNIAGTNVVNLLLVLGLSALLVPLSLQVRTLRFELPVMAGAAVLLWLLAIDGVLSRFDGLVLTVGAVVYTAAVVSTARRESRDVTTEFTGAYPKPDTAVGRTGLHVGMTLAGIVIIVVGAERLVDAAVGMARGFGVSDALIGLTVVAIGTSAPELVTTVVSTLRGERDIAVGNLLGSSIYNILLILASVSGASAWPRVAAGDGAHRHSNHGGRRGRMRPDLHLRPASRAVCPRGA